MLTLERQTSSSIERIGEKEVYIVVKQSIFTLTITSPHRIDGELTCELVYDLEDFIPVGYVSQNPLSYKIITITSNTINIECKLAVLSSKHEDLLFRVHVKLTSGNVLLSSLYSHPIKSTSKADSHRKLKTPTITDKQFIESKPRRVNSNPKRTKNSPVESIHSNTNQNISQQKRNKIGMNAFENSKDVPNGYIPVSTEQRMVELKMLESNKLLLDKLKTNVSHQNEKTKTLQGSVEELALRLAQYDYNNHLQIVYDVSTLFTPEQLQILQEISSIFQSACPMQNSNRNVNLGLMNSHANGSLQNPTQQTYNPCREVVGMFMPRNGDEPFFN